MAWSTSKESHIHRLDPQPQLPTDHRIDWGRLGRVGLTAGALIALAVLARRIDPHRLTDVFSQVRWPWVVAAAFLNLLNTGIESVRWTLLASSVKPGVRVWSAFKGMLASALGNVILPFKLGEGIRAYAFANAEAIPFASALSTVVLDRLIDGLCFLPVVVLTTWAVPMSATASRVSVAVFAGIAVALTALFVVARPRRRSLSPVDRVPPSRLAAQLVRFADGLSGLRRGRLLFPALAVGLLSWSARMTVAWLMLQAFGLTLPFAAAGVMLVFVNLGMAVVGAPGNVGAFEVAAAGALTLFSVPQDMALSVGVAYHVIELLPQVVLGLVLVGTGHVVVRRPPPSAEV